MRNKIVRNLDRMATELQVKEPLIASILLALCGAICGGENHLYQLAKVVNERTREAVIELEAKLSQELH